MDIYNKLQSQLGDDVQHVFDQEALFKEASDEIRRLRELLLRRGIDPRRSGGAVPRTIDFEIPRR